MNEARQSHNKIAALRLQWLAYYEEEDLLEIAARLSAISKSEEHHEERYQKLLKQVEAGTVFKKSEETAWVCRECGYVHTGPEAPAKCPACDHPQAHYQVKCEEY